MIGGVHFEVKDFLRKTGQIFRAKLQRRLKGRKERLFAAGYVEQAVVKVEDAEDCPSEAKARRRMWHLRQDCSRALTRNKNSS